MSTDHSLSFHVTAMPRDPVIARDGRPFSAGLRMRALDSIYPSVFAGSLRTLLGQLSGGFPKPGSADYLALTERLKNIAIAGPVLSVTSGSQQELAFAAPLDAVSQRLSDGNLAIHPVRPVELDSGAGCDVLPDLGMFPVTFSADVDPEFKPEPTPPIWSASVMSTWLADDDSAPVLPAGTRKWPSGFHRGAAKDIRFHAKIAPESGAAAEGNLFMTTALDLTRVPVAGSDPKWHELPGAAVVARVTPPDSDGTLTDLATWSPLGGERRIAFWSSRASAANDSLWIMPSNVETALHSAEFVRLVLATPAIFEAGWRPSWLQAGPGNKALKGQVGAVGVTLIGAAVGRWKAVSGWSYERKPPGPKPVRRMVPAGSVYFFRIDSGDPASLSRHWLVPLSDDAQDRRDGFGLGLWGPWKPFNNERFETRES